MISRYHDNRAGRYMAATAVLVGVGALLLKTDAAPSPRTAEASPSREASSPSDVGGSSDGALESFAQRDPLAFLLECQQRCREQVRDYRCTFTRHERVDGRLHAPQTARVRCRVKPLSVDMVFVSGDGPASRVLYVDGKWTDRQGRALAWIWPSGVVAKLFVPKLLQPIHGSRAQQVARNPIDEFGFHRAFERILRYCLLAAADGELDLRFAGEGMVADRPTYVFERHNPPSHDGRDYPDRLLVVHMDKDLGLPIACVSYADRGGSELVGRYVYTNVELNVSLCDADFEPR